MLWREEMQENMTNFSRKYKQEQKEQKWTNCLQPSVCLEDKLLELLPFFKSTNSSNSASDQVGSSNPMPEGTLLSPTPVRWPQRLLTTTEDLFRSPGQSGTVGPGAERLHVASSSIWLCSNYLESQSWKRELEGRQPALGGTLRPPGNRKRSETFPTPWRVRMSSLIKAESSTPTVKCTRFNKERSATVTKHVKVQYSDTHAASAAIGI